MIQLACIYNISNSIDIASFNGAAQRGGSSFGGVVQHHHSVVQHHHSVVQHHHSLAKSEICIFSILALGDQMHSHPMPFLLLSLYLVTDQWSVLNLVSVRIVMSHVFLTLSKILWRLDTEDPFPPTFMHLNFTADTSVHPCLLIMTPVSAIVVLWRGLVVDGIDCCWTVDEIHKVLVKLCWLFCWSMGN